MRQKPLLRTDMPDQGLRLKKGNVMVYPKYSAEGPPVSPIKGLRLGERAGLPKIGVERTWDSWRTWPCTFWGPPKELKVPQGLASSGSTTRRVFFKWCIGTLNLNFYHKLTTVQLIQLVFNEQNTGPDYTSYSSMTSTKSIPTKSLQEYK